MSSYSVKLATYAILAVVCGSLIIGSTLQFDVFTSLPEIKEGFGSLQRFSSASELATYLKDSTHAQRFYVMEAAPNVKTDASIGGLDYSGPNLQVAGVDEADKVKTDGAHLYIPRGTLT